MGKTRVAFIGTGNIFEMHIAAYKLMDNVEIVALCDIVEERVKQKAIKHGIDVSKAYTDMYKMFEENVIDAVNVCTPNFEHARCTIAALRAGCNVICEKPMAINVKEAEEMTAEAKKSGKLLMLGFVCRHDNNCNITKQFINEGYFGDIYYGKMKYLRRNGNPGGWFADKNLSGGGPMIDLGVHYIDLMRYIMGNPKPESVYCVMNSSIGCKYDPTLIPGYISADNNGVVESNVEDMATAIIRFEGGKSILVETSFVMNISEDECGVEVFGTKAGAKIVPNYEMYIRPSGYTANMEMKSKMNIDNLTMFKKEMTNFIDAINGDCECIAPAQDGVEIMKILCAAYKSAETGHEVIID